jgi:hypothetical protein
VERELLQAAKTRRLRRAPAVVLVALAVTAVACSSSPSASRTVASLPGGGTRQPSPGPPSVAQTDQHFVDFARCMRSHGVAMADPFHRPGHQGLTIDLPTRDSASRGAYAACEHDIAPIEQAKGAAAASVAGAHLQALARYARCMRAHDISMLDPTPQGQLNLGAVSGMTSDFGRYSPQFRRADAVCRHFLPAGIQDDGTGP